MGINYYLVDKSEHPSWSVPHTLHIGKVSGGWNFALQVWSCLPSMPRTWEDWIPLIMDDNHQIQDEGGDVIPGGVFIEMVIGRELPADWPPSEKGHGIAGLISETGVSHPGGLVSSSLAMGHHPTLPIDYFTGDFG